MTNRTTADIYLAKAEESLAGAESEYANDRYNNCANRAYYACFEAAIAALVRVGVGPSRQDNQWRHAHVQAQFSDQLVNRRKLYPGNLRETLGRGAILRATADYSTDTVSETQAYRGPPRAREFVEAVRTAGGQPR